MPLIQAAEQMIGSEFQQFLVANASVAVGNWHVAPKAATSPFNPPYALLTGLQTTLSGEYLYSAGKYLQLVVDITAVGGAGTLTVAVRGVDPNSGKVYTILASTALAAVATTVLRVGPALTAAANLVANDFVPLTWGVDCIVGGNAVSFSLTALQMP